jgi:hypothetical protein
MDEEIPAGSRKACSPLQGIETLGKLRDDRQDNHQTRKACSPLQGIETGSVDELARFY